MYQTKNQVAGNSVQVKDRIVSQQSEPSQLNERNSLRSELRNAMQVGGLRCFFIAVDYFVKYVKLLIILVVNVFSNAS